MGAGSRGLETSYTAFPGHEQGPGSEVKKLKHGPKPIWNARTAGRLACKAATVASIRDS